jgi:prevent-host-death family protein
MRMGLREANQRFSKAVKAVKAGEEVVLTERGTPIAVLRSCKIIKFTILARQCSGQLSVCGDSV